MIVNCPNRSGNFEVDSLGNADCWAIVKVGVAIYSRTARANRTTRVAPVVAKLARMTAIATM